MHQRGCPSNVRYLGLLLLSLAASCDGSSSKPSAAPGDDGGGAGSQGGNEGSVSGGDNSGSGNGQDGDGGSVAPGCETNLESRLSVTTVDVDVDVSYLVSGYDGFPVLDRIELAVAPSGEAELAFMTADHGAVHVVPLDASLARRGDDVVVPGLDLGGLVAHDDGFAVLTRREDPGAEVAVDEPETPNKAAVLVRYRDGQEAFVRYLTGTSGVDGEKDFSNGLNGALRWNGKVYGSYFVIRGGKGHWAEGHYGDKLVYVDDAGDKQAGGWGWNCSHNEGIRLLAEPERFTPLCFSDAYPNPGLNLVIEGSTTQLAPEQNWAGYTAGNFGSILKLKDGRYLVAWSSKGDGGVKTPGDPPEIMPAKQTSDIAFTHLDADRTPSGEVKWLTDTQDGIAELDVRLAPYGDGVLAMWQRIENVADDKAMPFGHNAGSRVQLISNDGVPMGAELAFEGGPTWNADLTVLPGGDLSWAYVLDARETMAPFSAPEPVRQIKIARFRACR